MVTAFGASTHTSNLSSRHPVRQQNTGGNETPPSNAAKSIKQKNNNHSSKNQAFSINNATKNTNSVDRVFESVGKTPQIASAIHPLKNNKRQNVVFSPQKTTAKIRTVSAGHHQFRYNLSPLSLHSPAYWFGGRFDRMWRPTATIVVFCAAFLMAASTTASAAQGWLHADGVGDIRPALTSSNEKSEIIAGEL